ncbi:MAG TPA: GntR family transcriptional regulator [Ramlibacter sp.]|nr:GntR family transcriptional regulator [Ramlibacter sp.]
MARSAIRPAANDAPLRPGGVRSPFDEGSDIESRVYNAVFESVMSQRLAPGTKLPEGSLCELFGASRATVRKVLQRLAHDHIVQLRPNRGAVIAMPSPDETRQIFEARRGLEAIIVNLATQNATKDDLTELRQQLKVEHHAMHRIDQPAWGRLASSFHLRLATLARNPILERYLVELISRCSLIVAYEPPGNASCEHDEHERIVECIAKGDAAGAVQLMDEHLRQLERNVSAKRGVPGRTLAHLLGLA